MSTLLCLLSIVLSSSILGGYASRPASKLRGTNNVSTANFCFQAEFLQEKYEQCGDEECRSQYRPVILGAIEEARKAGQKCDFARESEQICPKMERYIQEYNTILASSPQDLLFLVEKINTLKQQTSAKGMICGFNIPNFNLCAQVKQDVESIDSECSDSSFCKAYHRRRAITILSQLQKHNHKCNVRIPEADNQYEQEVDMEQPEGIEIIKPINSVKAGFCQRARNELENYENCEDLECQLSTLEYIKGSIQKALDSGEGCNIIVPKIEFCTKAASQLRSFNQCDENIICRTQYRNLLQETLEYAAKYGQQCDIEIPVIKTVPRLNSSSEFKASNLNDVESPLLDEEINMVRKTDVKSTYGYSISIEL